MFSYVIFRVDKFNKYVWVLVLLGFKFGKIGENFVDFSVNKKDYELELEIGLIGFIWFLCVLG